VRLISRGRFRGAGFFPGRVARRRFSLAVYDGFGGEVAFSRLAYPAFWRGTRCNPLWGNQL